MFILFVSSIGFSQSSSEPATTLFAQGMIEVQNQDELKALESQIKLNPFVKMVRIDYATQRVFIVTKDIESLSEEDFTSWFGEHSSKLRCIQIGVQGVDEIHAFPFQNCDK